jgi:hypothetical protein
MCFQEESFLKLHKDWPGWFDKFKGNLENYIKKIVWLKKNFKWHLKKKYWDDNVLNQCEST